MACNILDECYSNDPPKTLNMLCMERPAYLKRSQLTLAEEGECKYFIEHQASQTCVKGVWFGNISEQISTKKVSLAEDILIQKR
ncbi:unnamed protein product [Dibothriocephalus latus]|uniref:Uncharacterized protein n=1 Tax=Dibothriocephalus latus TaxID=60516 RepID=A0A3P6PK13_DIBLA|nr:unnamed protein product [Dibothriocephalus latus]